MGGGIPRRSTKSASVGKCETREENLVFSRTSTRSNFLHFNRLIQGGHLNTKVDRLGQIAIRSFSLRAAHRRSDGAAHGVEAGVVVACRSPRMSLG